MEGKNSDAVGVNPCLIARYGSLETPDPFGWLLNAGHGGNIAVYHFLGILAHTPVAKIYCDLLIPKRAKLDGGCDIEILT